MALLRLIHAADLPDPAALIAQLASGATVAAAPTRASAPATSGPSAALPANFASFIETINATKKLLAQQLHDHVGLVSFSPGELILKPLKPLGADFTRDLALAAREATGQAWQVRLNDDGGEPSLQQQEVMAEERARAAILDESSVRALLDIFPDATLETVTRKEA